MTSLLNTIKKFVKQSGDHLLLFDGDEALWVVVTLEEYERLLSSRGEENRVEHFSETPYAEASGDKPPAGVFNSPMRPMPGEGRDFGTWEGDGDTGPTSSLRLEDLPL